MKRVAEANVAEIRNIIQPNIEGIGSPQ
jgi:hypothetical protein